jgi:hypothetical protein
MTRNESGRRPPTLEEFRKQTIAEFTAALREAAEQFLDGAPLPPDIEVFPQCQRRRQKKAARPQPLFLPGFEPPRRPSRRNQ